MATPGIAQVAVPYYGPEDFVAGLQAHGQAPLATEFASTSQQLVAAVGSLCSAPDKGVPASSDDPASQPSEGLATARDGWLATAGAWERLEAVSVGPTLERRVARAVDFRPTRPRLILRAIARQGRGKNPPDARALERVGTPAKGLPALEWLLWDDSAPQTDAACRYAIGLAQAVAREAAGLAVAHASEAARDWQEEGEAAQARAAEAVNQWLAGLEVLRWGQLGKPQAVSATKRSSAANRDQDIWPRPSSGSHREAWQARWESLRNLAIGPSPTDGFGPQPAVAPALISLEALLRGRGRNEDADAWAKVVMAADQAMQELTEAPDDDADVANPSGASQAAAAPPTSSARAVSAMPPAKAVPLPPVATMDSAVKALDAVKQFMQAKVAPALKITLRLSDTDGE